MSVVLQRIYDDDHTLGGHRILVDRVWPRGISKEEASLEKWMKEIAPSSSLRKWFDHESDKFDEFKSSYQKEIESSDEKLELLKELKEMADGERLVLLFGAKNETYNHAVVLKEMIENG